MALQKVSLGLSDADVRALDKERKQGFNLSRSEFIRGALRGVLADAQGVAINAVCDGDVMRHTKFRLNGGGH